MDNKDKSTIIKSIIPYIVIFVGSMFTITELNVSGPVFIDELGYMANGASLLGYDWKDAFAFVPYYAYGYSLVLGLMWKILGSPLYVYFAAKIINVVLLMMAYNILVVILKRLVNCKATIIPIVACIVSLSPNLMVMKNFALPEVAIYFFFLLSILLISKYEEIGQYRYKIGALLLGFVLLSMHMRLIGVFVCIVLLTSLIDLKKQKINAKNIVIYISVLILGILILAILKNFFVENIALGQITDSNSVDNQVGKVKSILSAEGVENLAISFLGKMWTICLGTCGIFIWGLIGYVKLCRSYAKENVIWPTFIGLSFLAELTISCIYMYKIDDRIDLLFYSRYFYFTAIPILVIGLFYIIEKADAWYEIPIVLGIIMLMSILLQEVMIVKNVPNRIIPYSIAEIMIWWNKENQSFQVILATKATLLYSVANNVIKNRKVRTIVASVAIALIFLISTFKTLDDSYYSSPWSDCDFIEEFNFIEYCDEEIVYVNDGQWNNMYIPAWIQLMLPDEKISICQESEMHSGELYLVTQDMYNNMLNKEDITLCQETDKFCFIRVLD